MAFLLLQIECEVSFEPFCVLEWSVSTLNPVDQVYEHKQGTDLTGRPPHSQHRGTRTHKLM
jgi:hypothetical protein